MEKVFSFIYLLLVWLSTCSISIDVKASYDSLKPGDIFNVSSKLYSKQGKYSLFFAIPSGNGNTHLSITSPKFGNHILWMADRNQTLDPNSPVLSLNHYGVLKIEYQNAKPIILYSPSQPITKHINTMATLLDTGNLVLQQFNPNGLNSTILWQSFDYPVDTLLPGMKLGINRKTRHIWTVVSWLTDYITTPGAFSLEWEPKTRELIIKQREKVYWKSGKLRNNGTIFENIPENLQLMYQYTIVSNNDEDSFTFKINTTYDNNNNNNNEKFEGWMISPKGWLGSGYGEIANAGMCYGYNNTEEEGCQRWDIPTCREPGDVFHKKTGNPTNYMDAVLDTNTSYGYSDCRNICWNNCSCTGFKKFFSNGTGCIFFMGNSTKDVVPEDGSFYILEKHTKVAPTKGYPTMTSTHKLTSRGKKKWIWRSAIIALVLLITCPPILCLTFKKLKYGIKEKKSKRRESKMPDLTASNESSIIRDLESDLKRHDIKVFDYPSILTATMGFSEESKLGQGGYGPVYKGILPTGQEVAVKRLAKTSGQGIVEFKNELTLICELQHTNLVQLLGCCIHEDEKILLYEYLPNKSLDFFLFDCTRSKFLDWKTRFNIIEGISQGLLYLHKYSRLKIIHRDLKVSNILLDESMNPKISDFGMARMFTPEKSTSNTNRIVGTYGYMSPEYAMEGVFSTKSDVYSFGVLLLEIVSGRKNNSFYHEDQPQTLIGYAWELWKKGESLKLVDPSLNNTFIADEVQRCIHVGLLCVEHYVDDRPTMSEVISMLTSKHELVTLPKRPAFCVGRKVPEETATSKVSETYFTKECSTSSEVPQW